MGWGEGGEGGMGGRGGLKDMRKRKVGKWVSKMDARKGRKRDGGKGGRE